MSTIINYKEWIGRDFGYLPTYEVFFDAFFVDYKWCKNLQYTIFEILYSNGTNL